MEVRVRKEGSGKDRKKSPMFPLSAGMDKGRSRYP